MEDIQHQIAEAVQLLQTQIRWKPNSAERHLKKRKRQGHLPQEATLEDYENIILAVLHDNSSQIYLFWYQGVAYIAIVTSIQGMTWLVMFGFDGLMESAYVINLPNYLDQPGFEKIGPLREVMDES